MAGLTTDRDLNDLIEESQTEGFVIKRLGNGHLQWIPPTYPEAAFTTAVTPTSRRVVEHAKLQKRRALAGYAEHLPPEKKQAALARMAQRNQERKEAKAALTARPFRVLLRSTTRSTAIERSDTQSLGPTGKERISMFEAAKKAKELCEISGKTIEECAENIALAFDVMTPAKTKTGARSILNIVNRKKKPIIEVPSIGLDPYLELMANIRSTIKLPLDKKMRLEIIANLLDQALT